VLAAAEHRLGAVEPQRMNADLDFARAGRRDVELLDLQDLGASGFVKSHNAGHGVLLVSAICLGRSVDLLYRPPATSTAYTCVLPCMLERNTTHLLSAVIVTFGSSA